MSFTSRAAALLQKQYEVIFLRMRQSQWFDEFGAFVSKAKTAVTSLQHNGQDCNYRSMENLEPRLLMTTLYWDVDSAAGLQAGSGAWDTTAQNWNTAADGSGSQVAWIDGADAVFSANGSSTIAITTSVAINSIEFSGTGYTISGGALTLVAQPIIPFDYLNVLQNATIQSKISGTSGLQIYGTSTLTLTGVSDYTGPTYIVTGATLRIGDGGTNGEIASQVAIIGGNLIYDRSDTVSINTSIGGGGSDAHLIQAGTGRLVLQVDNAYSGITRIDNGTLEIASQYALYGSTFDTDGTGTLDVTTADQFVYLGGLQGSRNLELPLIGTTRRTLMVGSNNFDTVFSGQTNCILNKVGTGTLTILNDLAYNVGINSGKLAIGNGGTVGSISSSYIGASGGILEINRSDAITLSGRIGGNCELLLRGGGTLILTGNSNGLFSGTVTIAADSTLQIGDGGTIGDLGTFSVVNNGTFCYNRSDIVTLANIVDGVGNLVQAGAGTLILTGANTYTGTTTIENGTLQIGAGSTSGVLGTGDIINDGNLIINRSNAVALSNVISGTGSLTKLGAGTLTLSGDNSFSGTTTISAGTVTVAHQNALSNSVVELANVAGVKLILSTNAVIAALSGGGATGGSVSLGAYTLTVGNIDSGYLYISAYLGIISGTGGLTVNGALALVNANTYTGITTIGYGGLLQIGANTTTGSIGAGAIINNGQLSFGRSNALTFSNAISGAGILYQYGSGVLTLTGANTYSGYTLIETNSTLQVGAGSTAGTLGTGYVYNYGNLTINRSNAMTVSNNIIGTGSLTKAGAGALTLSGVNTFTGTTTINAGSLILSGGSALSDDSDVVLANVASAKLVLADNETIGSLSGGGTTGGYVTLGSYELNVGNNNVDTTYSGVISGTGSLVKSGIGTLTLTRANTYTGATTIAGGTLWVNGSLVSNVNVMSQATLTGTGTMTGDVLVNDGGIIGPPQGLGILHFKNLTLSAGSIVVISINTNTVGTGYGQISVSGLLTINGATLSLSGTRSAGSGKSLVIFTCTSSYAIAGTFDGLGQGSIVSVNGLNYALSYVGGTGNDLVLTDVP